MRLSRTYILAAAAAAQLTTFALLSAPPAKPQQERTPVPGFQPEPRLADAEPNHAQKPNSAKRALPDVPRREPLQARGLTMGERFSIYTHSVANPESALSPAFGAAMGQGNDEPPEWGQGASGYGKRLASGYGRLVINRTIRFGIAALDHEDPRNSRSIESGFWRRFRYSTVHYVMARNDRGDLMPAYSRFAGAYGAAFIANAWYPESRANTGHALMRGSTSLAAGYAWHVFKEFWPDVKKAIHHRKTEEAATLETSDPFK